MSLNLAGRGYPLVDPDLPTGRRHGYRDLPTGRRHGYRDLPTGRRHGYRDLSSDVRVTLPEVLLMPSTPPVLHGCPGDCGETVAQHQLACRVCWRRLPRPLQDRINAAYRARRTQPFNTDRITAHRQVLVEALDWYRDHPPGRRP